MHSAAPHAACTGTNCRGQKQRQKQKQNFLKQCRAVVRALCLEAGTQQNALSGPHEGLLRQSCCCCSCSGYNPSGTTLQLLIHRCLCLCGS